MLNFRAVIPQFLGLCSKFLVSVINMSESSGSSRISNDSYHSSNSPPNSNGSRSERDVHLLASNVSNALSANVHDGTRAEERNDFPSSGALELETSPASSANSQRETRSSERSVSRSVTGSSEGRNDFPSPGALELDASPNSPASSANSQSETRSSERSVSRSVRGSKERNDFPSPGALELEASPNSPASSANSQRETKSSERSVSRSVRGSEERNDFPSSGALELDASPTSPASSANSQHEKVKPKPSIEPVFGDASDDIGSQTSQHSKTPSGSSKASSANSQRETRSSERSVSSLVTTQFSSLSRRYPESRSGHTPSKLRTEMDKLNNNINNNFTVYKFIHEESAKEKGNANKKSPSSSNARLNTSSIKVLYNRAGSLPELQDDDSIIDDHDNDKSSLKSNKTEKNDAPSPLQSKSRSRPHVHHADASNIDAESLAQYHLDEINSVHRHPLHYQPVKKLDLIEYKEKLKLQRQQKKQGNFESENVSLSGSNGSDNILKSSDEKVKSKPSFKPVFGNASDDTGSQTSQHSKTSSGSSKTSTGNSQSETRSSERSVRRLVTSSEERNDFPSSGALKLEASPTSSASSANSQRETRSSERSVRRLVTGSEERNDFPSSGALESEASPTFPASSANSQSETRSSDRSVSRSDTMGSSRSSSSKTWSSASNNEARFEAMRDLHYRSYVPKLGLSENITQFSRRYPESRSSGHSSSKLRKEMDKLNNNTNNNFTVYKFIEGETDKEKGNANKKSSSSSNSRLLNQSSVKVLYNRSGSPPESQVDDSIIDDHDQSTSSVKSVKLEKKDTPSQSKSRKRSRAHDPDSSNIDAESLAQYLLDEINSVHHHPLHHQPVTKADLIEYKKKLKLQKEQKKQGNLELENISLSGSTGSDNSLKSSDEKFKSKPSIESISGDASDDIGSPTSQHSKTSSGSSKSSTGKSSRGSTTEEGDTKHRKRRESKDDSTLFEDGIVKKLADGRVILKIPNNITHRTRIHFHHESSADQNSSWKRILGIPSSTKIQVRPVQYLNSFLKPEEEKESTPKPKQSSGGSSKALQCCSGSNCYNNCCCYPVRAPPCSYPCQPCPYNCGYRCCHYC